jgi:hypothetical protein
VDSRSGLQVTGSQVKNVEAFSTLAPSTFNAVVSTEFYGAAPYRGFIYGHMSNIAADVTATTTTNIIQSWGSWINASASTGASLISVIGVNAQAGRSYADDQNTNVSMIGGTFTSVLRNANAYTTSIMRGVSGAVNSFSSATGTVTDRAVAGDFSAFFSTPVTVNEIRVIDGSITLSGGAAATTVYGQRLRAATITAPSVLPAAYYPHAQEDTLGRNYFRSPTFFGSAIGTARSASNPSVEVEAVAGVSSGDVRLRSSSAVFDASNSSTNGTKYYNRGGAGISSTTQSYYEEGSYTPTTTNYTLGTVTATWTRIGRKVFLTINSASGVNNGTTTTGASSISLPAGLAPARSGLGLRGQPGGSASGNGLVGINAATGLLEISTTVTLDTTAKVIQAEYEV